MLYFRYILVLFSLLFCINASAENLGKYIGLIQTEWLDEGRKMKLLSSFSYIDPNGTQWDAPAGSIVDGASIPQIGWTFMGGPYEGKYRNASVIHDVACEQKNRAWDEVHEVFYWGMLASGVERWRAKVMYAAVYFFGPRWPKQVIVYNLPIEDTEQAKAIALKNANSNVNAEIQNIHPKSRTFQEFITMQPLKGDFEILLKPHEPQLTEAEFDSLREAIKVREMKGNAEFSLEEIRNYKAN